jgi:hypothetical protein
VASLGRAVLGGASVLLYGRAKAASQFIPGWPYSFVAVLEPGATSWTAILDAVRLNDDILVAAEVIGGNRGVDSADYVAKDLLVTAPASR